MNLKTVLDRLIADFQERALPTPTRRRNRLWGMAGKADVVVGMRRSGKTWLLYQQIQDLLAAGVPQSRILYLNFEDERLLPMRTAELDLILEAWFRRFPDERSEECWLFLDEIHVVEDWELFVRRLVDEGRYHVVVTGSSAKLLSREIATSLRGRSMVVELLPFGFDEFLAHREIEAPSTWPPSAQQRSRLQHELLRYLEVGGFPEVQQVDPEARRRVLRDYLDVVLFRDVVERHGISNTAALRYMVRALLSSPGGLFSIHRFYNDLKSQGVRVSKDTLHENLAHLEDAFLLFTMPVAKKSARARMVNPRKGYPIDPALARTLSLRVSGDTGHLLECLVFLELKRRGWSMGYVATPSGREVDFFAQRTDTTPMLVQVCADMSEPKTRTRELRAIAEARHAHPEARAVVVTMDEEDQVGSGDEIVELIPAWRWLLEDVPP